MEEQGHSAAVSCVEQTNDVVALNFKPFGALTGDVVALHLSSGAPDVTRVSEVVMWLHWLCCTSS